jgi:hypothetical protein
MSIARIHSRTPMYTGSIITAPRHEYLWRFGALEFPHIRSRRARRPARHGQRERRRTILTTEGNRVLLVGRIRELAIYRAEVLQEHGFIVTISSGLEEASAIINNGEFDIAILSYTLPSSAVEELAELIRGYHPECPLITISEKRWIDKRIDPDAIVIADDGPAGLIAALRRVTRPS